MDQNKRNKIRSAPIVGGVVGAFTFFMLYGLAGLSKMGSDVAGIPMGLLISGIFAVVVGSVLFGELLANALEGK